MNPLTILRLLSGVTISSKWNVVRNNSFCLFWFCCQTTLLGLPDCQDLLLLLCCFLLQAALWTLQSDSSSNISPCGQNFLKLMHQHKNINLAFFFSCFFVRFLGFFCLFISPPLLEMSLHSLTLAILPMSPAGVLAAWSPPVAASHSTVTILFLHRYGTSDQRNGA